MSLKLKALGLGILATLAMSAVAVMNASAESTGHFTSDVTSTTILGTEVLGTEHRTELTAHGLEGGVVCDEVSYHGHVAGTTTTDISIFPTYKKCHTTPSAVDTTTVTMNECYYTFTSGGTRTVHLKCPPNKAIEVHHPNCTITIPEQTVAGVIYDVIVENGKHIITLTANTVQFTTEYHGGICIFTGTHHTGTLHGSATVRGFDTLGKQVNITAT